MSDLHENLNAALAAVEPGAAPVEAAMLTGRKIRNRRRAGLLAGAVAVVVAAAVGVPALTRQQALPAPTTSHIRVTVNPPGPHSPAGLIASGLIGSTPWNVTVTSSSSGNCSFEGNGMSIIACTEADQAQPTAAAPISFQGEGSDGSPVPFNITFGEVWKDVVSARVELSDGTILTLHPAEVDGSRYVAFASPASVLVDSVTAYSRSGAIATAIPFDTARRAAPQFRGLAPSRPGPARPADRDVRVRNGPREAVARDRVPRPVGNLPHRRPRRRLPRLAAARDRLGRRLGVLGRGDGRRFGVLPGDHAQGRQHRAGGGDRGRLAEVLGRTAQLVPAGRRPLDRLRRAPASAVASGSIPTAGATAG